MGNRQFKIAVQVDQEVCRAGEVVAGKVYLYIPRGTKGLSSFQGVHLKLKGSEHSVVIAKPGTLDYDQRKRNGRPLVEKSTQTVVHVDYPLVDLRGIKHGQYEYPFNLPLREDLPGSLYCSLGGGDKSYCQIVYSLSAYIDVDGSFPLHDSKLCHEMNIKLKGKPSGTLGPTPFSTETNIYPVTSCWLWKQGYIALGWKADRSVVSPGDNVHIHCWGENQSRLKVTYLSFKWIECTTWMTESGVPNGRRVGSPVGGTSKKATRILREERVSVDGLSSWNSVKTPKANRDNLLRENNNAPTAVSTLNIPHDARDSYQGRLVHVKHTLVVCAHTIGGWSSTSPEFAAELQVAQRGSQSIQQISSSSSSSQIETADLLSAEATPITASAPSELYDETGGFVQAEAIPDNWHPVAAEVVNLPLASAVVISDSVDVLPPRTPAASAPDESLLAHDATTQDDNPKKSNVINQSHFGSVAGLTVGTTSELDQLAHLAAECPENLPIILSDPQWSDRIQNLSPPEFCRFVQVAESEGPFAARTLAIIMGPSFQCKHVLACLWSLQGTRRVKLLQDVAPLASDIRSKYSIIEDELNNQELHVFRSALNV